MNNFKIYFASNLISAAVPFLLLPILTRFLTTEEYGQVAIYQILFTFFTAIVGLSTHASVYRESFDMSTSERSKYIGSCLQIAVITAFLMLSIVLLSNEHLTKILNVPLDVILLALLSSTLNYFLLINLGQWQVFGKAKKFAILQIFLSILNVALSLSLVVKLSLGVEGRIVAHSLSITFGALVSIVVLVRICKLNIIHICMKNYRKALGFSLPLVPHSIFAFVLLNVDRIIINEKIGIENVGIYLSAIQLSLGISVFYDAVLKALSPWVNRKLNTGLKKNLHEVEKAYLYLSILSLILIAVVFFFSPGLSKYILGKDYSAASDIVASLCIAQVFRGLYQLFSCVLQFYKKTFQLMICTVVSGVSNLILIFSLIDIYKLVGVSYAFMLSAFILLMATLFLSYKYSRR